MAGYKKPELESVVWPELMGKTPSLEGKLIAITGCTSGTGLHAALGCAKKGATVLMLNRASERAQKAVAQVKEVGAAEHIDCDLQSFQSVRAAAQVIKEKFPEGLDVLANNAGIMAFNDESAEDGFDVQMTVNHLSHFLLTKELFPLLDKRPDPRIVNHSSEARKGPPLEGRFLEKGMAGKLGGNNPEMGGEGNWRRYHMTKLANCLFTFALAHKLKAKGSKVKALVAHPGLATTELQSTTIGQGGWNAEAANGFMPKGQSAEDGAAGLFRCISDPEAQSGDFFGPPNDCWLRGYPNRIPPEDEPNLLDQAQWALLWDASVAAVGGDIF